MGGGRRRRAPDSKKAWRGGQGERGHDVAAYAYTTKINDNEPLTMPDDSLHDVQKGVDRGPCSCSPHDAREESNLPFVISQTRSNRARAGIKEGPT